MKSTTDRQSEEQARARYNRIAWMYDASEYFVERFVFQSWRRRLWSMVPGGRGLEVGVGTGKNIPFYPQDADVIAIDLSPKMLDKARERAKNLGAGVEELLEMNVEKLSFPDHSFDWAAATFVFCSVPDPIHGFNELARVVKPGGKVFLLEHVRIDRPVLGKCMDLWNPIVVRLTGANINRQTVNNVKASGLKIDRIENVGPLGVAKLIIASA